MKIVFAMIRGTLTHDPEDGKPLLAGPYTIRGCVVGEIYPLPPIVDRWLNQMGPGHSLAAWCPAYGLRGWHGCEPLGLPQLSYLTAARDDREVLAIDLCDAWCDYARIDKRTADDNAADADRQSADAQHSG